jgi:hypothetical protein
MALATKSELAALFITEQEMILHRQTLIVMFWPKPKCPIQTNNSTAVGVVNKTAVPRRSKMMDMPFWWLHHPKINFIITGMQMPRTGPTTTPSTTLTPTTKPIKACMQVAGLRWVLKPIPRSLLPMSPRVFPCRFSLFFFHIYHMYVFNLKYFPHIVNVSARVCTSPDSWVWTDHPQI